jgi:H+/gluconate symporter-like permease
MVVNYFKSRWELYVGSVNFYRKIMGKEKASTLRLIIISPVAVPVFLLMIETLKSLLLKKKDEPIKDAIMKPFNRFMTIVILIGMILLFVGMCKNPIHHG